MATELQQAAALINKSNTGSTATVMADHVSVQVPGIGSTGGKTYRFYSTEKVRSLRAAARLVDSMQ